MHWSRSWENQSPSYQPKETRVRNLREVSLGFSKKIAQDEARRCPQCAVATCLPGCPLGIDIPGFIRLLREGDTAFSPGAYQKREPFSGDLRPYMSGPLRAGVYFSCGWGCRLPSARWSVSPRISGPFKGQKSRQGLCSGAKKWLLSVAGPSGMSAAYYLAKTNFSVTIFEAAHEPGGLLRYAIPEFRLPQKVLDEQLTRLKSLGVEIQTDVVFGRTLMIDEIFMQGFSAVLLATGASLPVFSDLPGSSLAGVYYDMEFLSGLQNINKEDAFAEGRQTQEGISGQNSHFGWRVCGF